MTSQVLYCATNANRRHHENEGENGEEVKNVRKERKFRRTGSCKERKRNRIQRRKIGKVVITMVYGYMNTCYEYMNVSHYV